MTDNDDSFKIHVLYDLNHEKESNNWCHKDMPPSAECIGKENDDSGKWNKRETRAEQFQCDYKYKEELIHYLNFFFSDLLLNKHTINRFIVTQSIQQYYKKKDQQQKESY